MGSKYVVTWSESRQEYVVAKTEGELVEVSGGEANEAAADLRRLIQAGQGAAVHIRRTEMKDA